MPIRRRQKNDRNNVKQAAIGGILFSLLCGLVVLSGTNSVDDLHLLLNTETLQRSLSSDNSQFLYLRSSGEEVVRNFGKYKPLDCQSFLKKARQPGIETVEDPNNGILHGKQVEIDPKFWISLHNKEFDDVRWHLMEFGLYYERALSEAFVEVLANSPPGSRVVDVGGNIGFFTLLSASQGPVTVDTFEPNQKNQLRVCESLALNHWQSEFDKDCTKDPTQNSMVNIYPFGAGRKEGILTFMEHQNPGQGVFVERPPTSYGTGLQVVTLDNFAEERGWFTTRPDIAILKVDVEGMEYTVIEGAIELIKAKIVRNIFMEVSARTANEMNINRPALRILSENGYKLHKIGGWRGPDRDVDFPQDQHLTDHIMFKTMSEKPSMQLNLWWKLEN